ncbi:hypothetical protein ACU5AX_04245 [Sphingomonas sp. XXL09]|uniref:hypothetical protein n=1 Tax=Sphingomonas sp. XXL09 TaxID=3457787 RepID=UPI00406BD312
MRTRYHFPNERRREERRVAPAAPYPGPERRLAQRRNDEVKLVRKREPIHRGVLWAGVLALFCVVDAVSLGGAYRHMVENAVSDAAARTRDWSAHVWDWGH